MKAIHKTAVVHPTAIIYDNVVIEENVHIGPYCIIGAPAEWKGKESTKGVRIGYGSILTGLVTVDAGVEQTTFVGPKCYIMKHAHIGHDAFIYNDVTVSCGAKIGGHAIIGKNNNIGLNAVVHQKKEIPPNCMIGMGSVITKGLVMKAGMKYAGNPAKLLGENIKK
jgi:acyl-[acyl carrier protein]--UDP-N-acetylglucosamine O-acyltransferase